MPRGVKLPQRELEELAARETDSLLRAVRRLMAARAAENSAAEARAVEDLAEVIGETMILADLLGRRRAFLEVDSAKASPRAAVLFDDGDREFFGTTPVSGRLTFDEMVNDLVSREPRLAEPVGGEPRWRAVARLYRDEHAFALARSVNLELTRRIQRTIARSAETAAVPQTTEDAISFLGDFSQSYADTVYRTTMNASYTAGRLQQVKDPAVRAVAGAFEFNTARDADVRPNHAAAQGLVAPFGHQVWDTFATPIGYN